MSHRWDFSQVSVVLRRIECGYWGVVKVKEGKILVGMA
jgi:hypothetical protein